MWEKIKAKFCDGAGQWYKMWSTWLAGVWASIVTMFWADPGMLLWLANSMPPEIRVLISPLVFAAVAALPILVRLIKQRKLEQPK